MKPAPMMKQMSSPTPAPVHTCRVSFFLRNMFCSDEDVSDGSVYVDCAMNASRTDTMIDASRHSLNTMKKIGTEK